MERNVNYQGFNIEHSGTVVRVTKSGVSREVFADEVDKAMSIISKFRMSSPGSTWGCDGVGFEMQARIGVVEVKRSGVGPRKFKEGLKSLA